ncbi:MAG: arginyltransferase [Alphaproteobacteria bacterium]|nr:arginyltransferase [Alphaproteobacteria bacterium]
MDQTKFILNQKPLNLRLTRSHECAYIKNRAEQRLAADISDAPYIHDQLAESGFRRVENWVYRPVCVNCNACVPIRVNTQKYVFSKSAKRILSKNASLSVTSDDTKADDEAFELFKTYLNSRHNDGQMATMSYSDFHAMIHNSPIDTFMIKYRDQNKNLIACMLMDNQRDGLSAVYSFFNPNCEKQSLGTFLILDAIRMTETLSKKWLYLGYLVQNSPKMTYKSRFKPYQLFVDGKWQDDVINDEID